MAFGKPPISPELAWELAVSTWRWIEARNEGQIVARAGIPALQPALDEEVAHWREEFGEDERIEPHALSLVVERHLRPEALGHEDGEAIIEAIGLAERLEAGYSSSQPLFARWAKAVTAKPPKELPLWWPNSPVLRAVEMLLAFRLTSARRKRRPKTRAAPFDELLTQTLRKTLDRYIAKKGARFDRDPDTIVARYLDRLRPLKEAYRPSGNWSAPLAFIKRDFLFRLDDEFRRQGSVAVKPGWVRKMRRLGRLGPDEAVTSEAVEALRAGAEARMTHSDAQRPNAREVVATLKGLHEQSVLALKLATLDPRKFPPDLLDELGGASQAEAIREWLAEDAMNRAPFPKGLVDPRLRVSTRALEGLIANYERKRRDKRGQPAPFAQDGRIKRIPASEIPDIVAFANKWAARRRSAEPGT